MSQARQVGSVALIIRPLTTVDRVAIKHWPPYTGDFAPLDYALRDGGWLDMFPESAVHRQLGLWQGEKLVGFSLLTGIQDRQAEFYIAIHPSETGRGFGQRATRAVLDYGFARLGLQMIYLKVRAWHARGIHVYGKMGFVATGEKTEAIQGADVRFIIMEVRPDRLSRPA